MGISILLADDHRIVRQSLRLLLEREGFKVGGEASDGHEAIRLAQESFPDIAILDIAMPGLNGLDAARRIRQVSPRTRIVVLTMYTEDHYIHEAIRSGISGYVVKSQAAADLVQAINEVTSGKIYLSPSISRTVVEVYLAKTDNPAEPLTLREREVLQLIAEGKTTKEVAANLGISVKTAESHRTRMMEKLNIHQTAGLVRYALHHGLVN